MLLAGWPRGADQEYYWEAACISTRFVGLNQAKEKMTAFSCNIGFLPNPIAFTIPSVRLEPLAELESLREAVTRATNTDGHFYPPTVTTHRYPDRRDESVSVPVPNTTRPAQLFGLPSSHRLEIDAPVSATPISGDASFIAQLLAYLYGTRLQPEGWQFDSRVPVTRLNHSAYVGQQALERIVNAGYERYRTATPEARLRLTNILYLHAKAPCYEWDWEEFLVQFLVTDAMYRYCALDNVAVAVTHADRIKELCGRLGVWCDDETAVSEFVEMRNSLFHEALWEGERPGYSTSAKVHYRVQEFRELNHQLIAALLGGASTYTRHNWTDWRQVRELP